MKLPDDKNERIKILALVGIGVAGVLYAVWSLGIVKVLEAKKKTMIQITTHKNQLDKAGKEILKMTQDKETNAALIADIKDISSNYLLHHRLGNYLLPAQEIIERHASNAGMPIKLVQQLGPVNIPLPQNNKTPRTVQAYAVRVTTECGYNELVAFLKGLEESNPYLCVPSLQIIAIANKPEIHTVNVDIQWPAWVDEQAVTRMEERMKEFEERSTMRGAEREKQKKKKGT